MPDYCALVELGGMVQVNISKAYVLALAIVGVVVLMAFGRVSSEAGLPCVMALAGYAVGNGIAAKAGTTATPILAPKHERES